MAAAVVEDEYEDIGYIPPPTQPAPSDRYDNDLHPLPPLDDNDLLDSTQSSTSSSASSTATLARSLIIAWQNELHSPVLLPYQFALIRALQPFLTARQSSLDAASDPSDAVDDGGGGGEFSSAPSWQLNLYQLELDRLQYALTDYHRLRLTKLAAAHIHMLLQLGGQAGGRRLEQLSSEEVDDGALDVSGAELAYLLGYVDLWERVMRAQYLDHMPAVAERDVSKQLTGAGGEMVKVFDEDWFVVVRVVEGDGRDRVMMDDIEVELRAGEIWLVRFEPFRQFLNDGKVQLI